MRENAVSKYGVSVRGFNRVWDRAIEDTGNTEWNKAGRRKQIKMV
jgi:hypothetical protein